MENSIGLGFMAVFAFSGSIVLLAHQFNKRVMSHFMEDIEFELRGLLCKHHHDPHKKLDNDDVAELSSNNKEYRKRWMTKQANIGVHDHKVEGIMAINQHGKFFTEGSLGSTNVLKCENEGEGDVVKPHEARASAC